MLNILKSITTTSEQHALIPKQKPKQDASLANLPAKIVAKIMSEMNDMQTLLRFAQTNKKYLNILQTEKQKITQDTLPNTYNRMLQKLKKHEHIEKTISAIETINCGETTSCVASAAVGVGAGIGSSFALAPSIGACVVLSCQPITVGGFIATCGLFGLKDECLDSITRELKHEKYELEQPQPITMTK